MGVAQCHRGLGIGAALWDLSLDFLREQEGNRLSSEVLDNDPVGLGFAERCGFTIDRHHFYSILDLATFDETPYLPVITSLEAQGIHFCSLADLPDTPETRRKFYELNLSIVMDIPGEDWNFENYPTFFEKRILGSPRFRREGQLLAMDGDTLVGFAAIILFPDDQSAYNATTDVMRRLVRMIIHAVEKLFNLADVIFRHQHFPLSRSTDILTFEHSARLPDRANDNHAQGSVVWNENIFSSRF